MPNLDDIRPAELRLLMLLVDVERQDMPGLMAMQMSDRQRIDAATLEAAGMVSFDIGWRDIGWYGLTDRGREITRSIGYR